jgi:hypothetical protein
VLARGAEASEEIPLFSIVTGRASVIIIIIIIIAPFFCHCPALFFVIIRLDRVIQSFSATGTSPLGCPVKPGNDNK